MKNLNNKPFTLKDAQENFKKLTDHVNTHSDTVIYNGDKPAYLLLDINQLGPAFINEIKSLKVKWLSEAIMDEYDEAYKELAK